MASGGYRAFGRGDHYGGIRGETAFVRKSWLRTVFLRHFANAAPAVVFHGGLRQPA
jgi:hypothetical protein